METVRVKDLLFDIYIKVQLDIYKRFGFERLVLLNGNFRKVREKVEKQKVLEFLSSLLDKDDDYLSRFVEVEKDTLSVRITHSSETVSCFMV